MQKSDTGRFRKFYENEAVRYHSSRYRTRYGALFEKWHHEIIRDLLVKLPNDGMVLEIACGTGHLTSLLADLGLQFVSSDLTPEMMQQARARAGMRGISFSPTPSGCLSPMALLAPWCRAAFFICSTMRNRSIC
jgi:ubiquinone/menaquinone biosynthesis C-methylase UbiE